MNILVFPGGTEVGLEIQRSLVKCKDINLFSAGQEGSSHAPFIFERHFIVPSVYQDGWVERLNEILINNNIDFIFPAYDDVIVKLSENRNKINAKIVTSPDVTCLITRSKLLTYNLLSGVIPVPIIYNNIKDVKKFPVFVKPDKGQGSQNIHVVKNKSDLLHIIDKINDGIILEYLPGNEYTIDCFSDREYGLLFCKGRKRIRTKSGISMNTVEDHYDIFNDYAIKITSKLDLYGAWFFQLKLDSNGIFKLLEIAPRIAGTMAFYRALGVNFPLLSLYEQQRIPLKILTNNINIEIDRALINRFKHNIEYKYVYVDLDDTLIFKGLINTDLVKFIFQCHNNSKVIILITRHDGNITKTLQRFKIEQLFDKIIHIDKLTPKSYFINEKNSIFIDDSFSERNDVSTTIGIPTFDCSMIEMLLDDRG